MKWYKLLWLLFFLPGMHSIAQPSIPLYEINADTSGILALPDSCWQLLEDREGKWAFEEVSRSLLSERFHTNTSVDKGVDYSATVYWIRYRLKNDRDQDMQVLISQGFSAYADLYTSLGDGKWNHQITGYELPWSKRDGLKLRRIVPVVIPAGKELTDINALTDEYMRLSYHGLRAKDKTFNAAMESSFDESIGKINIVPQDFGRVLLNLFNNAFYSVTEKKKITDDAYKPTVSAGTKKLNGKIEISIRDNGMGIPKKWVGKILQPFFTTKPTGQGTGLGLSLSYDIIKAHGGELKVETKEGKFAEFIIILPN